MTTSQDSDGFNSKEDFAVSSDPFLKPSNTLQSSKQPLKGLGQNLQGQPSGGLVGTRSTADSSMSTLNKKTDDIMPIENKDQYAMGQVQDESAFTVSGPFKRVTTEENVSVVKRKGRQSSKKEEIRVKKNAPQKKKNPNFVKKSQPKTQKRVSKNKNGRPQSPYKNSYKAIYCEILSYIQFFCNPEPKKYEKIFEEDVKTNHRWKVDSENALVLAQAKTQEDTKSETDFIRWLEANKLDLEGPIEDKRYVKFLPLKDLITESKGLINETDCRTHFEKRKGRSVNKSQGEGMKLTWLLILTFSLVWLPKEPEEETLKLFPVQKHTVGLLSWLVSSRTHAKGKKILNNSKNRRHIREEMMKKFTTLYNSALSEFPGRTGWLKKLNGIVKETQSAQSTTETEPDTIMNEQVQSSIPDLQTINVSTACSEASFQDRKHAQDSFSAQSFAFVEGFKEIKYDKTNSIDCTLGSKLGFNCPQLIPMEFFEGLEDSYYKLESDLYQKTGSRVDVGQSQNGRSSFDEFISFNEEQLEYAKEFRWSLTGKRFKFLFDVNGYDDGYLDFKKKFKKM